MSERRRDPEAGKPMVLTDPCQRNGCQVAASWVVRLNVPVRGLLWAEPWRGLIGLEVCGPHFMGLRAADYLPRRQREIITEALKDAGVEPDFLAAFLAPIHIQSREYREFRKMRPGDVLAAGIEGSST